jgi:hypothetical protein
MTDFSPSLLVYTPSGQSGPGVSRQFTCQPEWYRCVRKFIMDWRSDGPESNASSCIINSTTQQGYPAFLFALVYSQFYSSHQIPLLAGFGQFWSILSIVSSKSSIPALDGFLSPSAKYHNGSFIRRRRPCRYISQIGLVPPTPPPSSPTSTCLASPTFSPRASGRTPSAIPTTPCAQKRASSRGLSGHGGHPSKAPCGGSTPQGLP